MVFSSTRAVRGCFLGLALSWSAVELADAHGTLDGSRMLQVRLAGPAGATPAAWNDSYYTWNQDSNNFPTYASPGFSYANFVPDGTIASAGINDGVQTALNFSGLNTPSANWLKTPATAGNLFNMTWLATAPHEPSHFAVYLTKPGFNVASQTLGWGNLEYLGSWAVGDASKPVTLGAGPNPVSGGTMTTYSWQIGIPADRSGHVAAVVVWQRDDPAGEAFFAVQDLNVAPVPEPSTLAFLGLGVIGVILVARRRAHAE